VIAATLAVISGRRQWLRRVANFDGAAALVLQSTAYRSVSPTP
jgi:hypothetical protein